MNDTVPPFVGDTAPPFSNGTVPPFAGSSNTQQLTRAAVLACGYALLLAGCRYVAYEIRFDFIVPAAFQQERLMSVALSTPIKLAFLLLFRQFRSMLTYFSVPDLLRITAAMGMSIVAAYVIRLVVTPSLSVPRGVMLIDFVLSVGALSSLRLGLRLYRERFQTGKNAVTYGQRKRRSRKVVVVGAGDCGAQFAQEALSKPLLGLRPVCFLDDDPAKHGSQIHGVPVLCSPEHFPAYFKDYPASGAIIAMPSATGRRVKEVNDQMTKLGLRVEIVPSMGELASGRVQVSKVRPVGVEDLLGREPVNLDDEAISRLVAGKVVMVTGAGGSIGSELCRQIAARNPKRLLLVEQAEGSLFMIEMKLNEAGFHGTLLPLVADILDEARMRYIFGRYAPEVVFHAAAHKHVYMMERQPSEAVKNNTFGTRRLGELAAEYRTGTFVFISTDKAINPTSVMGASKRLAEINLQLLNAVPGNSTRFIAVRFGNVLGSSGSVIPIFKRQIAAGGPVTVTDPEVTRYFMTIPEAVGLVLQTAVLGEGGEIFVLDMGQPVRIVDLARQLIELSGFRPDEDIEIKFVGLRPGEKLFEELQHQSEQLTPTSHPRIRRFVAPVPSADWRELSQRELDGRVHQMEANQIKLAIKKLVPEYSPHLD